MANHLYGRNIISIAEFSREDLELVVKTALDLKNNPQKNLLDGKLIASCFFEPSTRTRQSFETAIQRLGGRVIGFSDASNTSIKKGETLADTARILRPGGISGIVRRFPKRAGRRAA